MKTEKIYRNLLIKTLKNRCKICNKEISFKDTFSIDHYNPLVTIFSSRRSFNYFISPNKHKGPNIHFKSKYLNQSNNILELVSRDSLSISKPNYTFASVICINIFCDNCGNVITVEQSV